MLHFIPNELEENTQHFDRKNGKPPLFFGTVVYEATNG